ncbi:MAG: hypothetical protein IPP73_05060 [Chitinophagaceae bacterium]|nr:hypothetical protein [Chitinophagaceae bacterium]
MIDSFRVKINEPGRQVEVVDVMKEAMLSHLGIVLKAAGTPLSFWILAVETQKVDSFPKATQKISSYFS